MTASPRCVLVTAATTPLGIATCLQLAPHVRVLCARSRHEPEPPPSLAHAPHAVLDLARPRDVRDLLFGLAREQAVDTLVHLPAFHHGGEPARQVPRSVVATRNLLSIAEEQPELRAVVIQSSGAVYRIASDEPVLVDEGQALDFSPHAPARQRERLELDVLATAKIGVSRLDVTVLRMAELLGPHIGSALYDYLSTRVCLRPLGYDPMLNVLSIEDASRALALAALQHPRGIFNVRGADTLPLSELVHRAGRFGMALPGPALTPLYALRAALTARHFRYAPARQRLHYAAILDGHAAQASLGYSPQHPIDVANLFARHSR